MNPFNLKDALAGKPVVTRDGRKVFDLHHFPSASTYKLAGVVEGAEEQPSTFTEKGIFAIFSSNNNRDLFMASEKKEGWINLYKQSKGYIRGVDVHPSKSTAEFFGKTESIPDSEYITSVRVEWEE